MKMVNILGPALTKKRAHAKGKDGQIEWGMGREMEREVGSRMQWEAAFAQRLSYKKGRNERHRAPSTL